MATKKKKKTDPVEEAFEYVVSAIDEASDSDKLTKPQYKSLCLMLSDELSGRLEAVIEELKSEASE